MVTSPINPMRYWKLEEIQRMLNAIEGYENVVIEFQYQQSDDWTKRKVWECRCGIKEQLVNGQYSWLLKYVFAIEANDEGDARTIAWQEAAERLVTDVWRTSINSFRKEQQQRIANKKINYSDPLPREALDEILTKAEQTANNLEQQINKTNMTDNGTKILINTQTNTNTPNTNATDENIPTWKKLYKSFGYMMITFMFVYAGSNIIIWLYDALGMERVMPTLIGIIIWILVYDHMYGTASKAPRIK